MKTMEIISINFPGEIEQWDFPDYTPWSSIFQMGTSNPTCQSIGTVHSSHATLKWFAKQDYATISRTSGWMSSISATVNLVDCLHDLLPKSSTFSTEGGCFPAAFRGLIQWAENNMTLPFIPDTCESLCGQLKVPLHDLLNSTNTEIKSSQFYLFGPKLQTPTNTDSPSGLPKPVQWFRGS